MSRKPEAFRVAGWQARAPVFAALGDKTRLILIGKLCSGPPQSITSLAQGSRLTRQAITKHLRVLEDANLVEGVHQGRETLFHFKPAPLSDAQRYLAFVSRQWDDALLRLKALVESDPG
jgi:DNA-binding transcriptional ArsR family regulator